MVTFPTAFGYIRIYIYSSLPKCKEICQEFVDFLLKIKEIMGRFNRNRFAWAYLKQNFIKILNETVPDKILWKECKRMKEILAIFSIFTCIWVEVSLLEWNEEKIIQYISNFASSLSKINFCRNLWHPRLKDFGSRGDFKGLAS